MSLNSKSPDFKSRALAALAAGQAVQTEKGFAQSYAKWAGNYGFDSDSRPFMVRRIADVKLTRHASATLAVAFLASL